MLEAEPGNRVPRETRYASPRANLPTAKRFKDDLFKDLFTDSRSGRWVRRVRFCPVSDILVARDSFISWLLGAAWPCAGCRPFPGAA